LVATCLTHPSRLLAADSNTAASIRFLEDRVRRDPDDITALNRLSGECLQRMRETGDTTWLAKAEKAAEQSLHALTPEFNPAALAARASVYQASHRFKDAKADAEAFQRLRPDKAQGFELHGDAALELGELTVAEQDYARAQQAAGESLGQHVRLARLAWFKGDRDAAQLHYDGAVAFARLPQPPSPFWLAWALVQRGANFFSHGEWVPAEVAYAEASQQLPGAWFIVDRLGELRAAQGKWDEAAVLYRKAVELSPSPGLKQALADVLVAAGKPTEATPWSDQAEAGYLASINAGEAIYYHHLAGFYADSKPNPAEAEKWARKDLELRRTPAALEGLAWALHTAGKTAEAAIAAHEALAAGAETGSDSHVLYRIGIILMRAGEVAPGRAMLRRATEINPAVNAFHVHR